MVPDAIVNRGEPVGEKSLVIAIVCAAIRTHLRFLSPVGSLLSH